MNIDILSCRWLCWMLGWAAFVGFGAGCHSSAGGKARSVRPVVLYSRYFNAEGENRYLPDGTYREVLERLGREAEVRVDQKPLTEALLRDVDVVWIANPSDQAVGTNPPPHHFSPGDIAVIEAFIRRGGGLILSANQEDHNLEVRDTNRLLERFGMRFVDVYSDAKTLVLPETTPLIGGLRWGYYTGNQIQLDARHPAKPWGWVENDLKQKPVQGLRDAPGVLLAAAQLGRGRVLAVTDSGWLINDALSDRGVGGMVLSGQDNWEIFRRLVQWSAGRLDLSSR